MAYQNSYGARPMYTPGTAQPNNAGAGHFPTQQLAPQQQHQQFYPNSNPYPQSAAPSPAYRPAHGPPSQMNNGPRQQYLPNQNYGNGGAPLMAPPNPAPVPDDPFKKPYLPPQKADLPRHTQQQYMQNAHSPPSYTNNQQQPTSIATPSPSTATFPPLRTPNQISTTSTSYPPSSSMTVSAPPATSSAQSTPTSEAPPQTTDLAPQASKLNPLDQERVDAVLSVNNLLLQEVQILQKVGLKTPQSPQQPGAANAASPQAKPENATTVTDSTKPPPTSTSSTPTTTTPTTGAPPQPSQNQKKFVEYMRRLQSNIMFLVSINDPTGQRQRQAYPGHLEALPNWLADGVKDEDKAQLEALKEGYGKLRELWPDWKPGQSGPPQGSKPEHQGQAQKSAPMQQQSPSQPQS